MGAAVRAGLPGAGPEPVVPQVRLRGGGAPLLALPRPRLQRQGSHNDGKEKFVFLQQPAAKASAPAQKQSKKKSAKAAAGAAGTEMDMATAHKLFYGKPAGDRRHQQQQQSYLPYRPGIVGFFTSAHALGRSHHPY